MRKIPRFACVPAHEGLLNTIFQKPPQNPTFFRSKPSKRGCFGKNCRGGRAHHSRNQSIFMRNFGMSRFFRSKSTFQRHFLASKTMELRDAIFARLSLLDKQSRNCTCCCAKNAAMDVWLLRDYMPSQLSACKGRAAYFGHRIMEMPQNFS